MTRVLFLDIDGVLNSNFWNDNHQKEISDGTLIDEEKIKILAPLVKRTGAKVVLHSGWRFWFGKDLKPLCPESETLVEILLWLKQHSEVNGWVVLDDLDLHNADIKKHQVMPDQTIGLTPEDIVKAEKIILHSSSSFSRKTPVMVE